MTAVASMVTGDRVKILMPKKGIVDPELTEAGRARKK